MTDVDHITAITAHNAMGQPARYVPPSGVVVDCMAIRERTIVRTDALGEVAEMGDMVHILTSDVADPVQGSVVQFGRLESGQFVLEEAWTIDGAIEQLDYAVWSCPVVKC